MRVVRMPDNTIEEMRELRRLLGSDLAYLGQAICRRLRTCRVRSFPPALDTSPTSAPATSPTPAMFRPIDNCSSRRPTSAGEV
jgi:hypothetical protein